MSRINLNHFQIQQPNTQLSDMISRVYTQSTPPTHNNILNVVVGPIRCGKSTYISQFANETDIILRHSQHLTVNSLRGIHNKVYWDEYNADEVPGPLMPYFNYLRPYITTVIIHDIIRSYNMVHIYQNNNYIRSMLYVNWPTPQPSITNLIQQEINHYRYTSEPSI